MDYIELAMAAFEKNNYTMCVKCLIAAFEKAGKEDKEAILDFLYQNFILPNEEEFRRIYMQYARLFPQIEYEDLELDFIPVAEDQFFIFDKKRQAFDGFLDCNSDHIQLAEGKTDCFNGYVFADLWDLRQILPYSQKNVCQPCYLITSDVRKSAAFAKAPKFVDKFMKNIFVLENKQIFLDVFRQNPDIYIPKQLIAAESSAEIEQRIMEIHRERVENTSYENNNILLSICIPSYNRGNRALAAVKNILQSFYDAEIEVIVSNNGSVSKTEGYEEIKKIKDSRLRYYEFKENQQFMGNIVQALSMARGKFAVLCSDEDLLLFDELPFYMGFLNEHPDLALMYGGGIGKNLPVLDCKTPRKFEDALAANINATSWTYITGTIYNMELLRQHQCLEKVREYQKLPFVKVYTHLFINMMLSYAHPVYICSRMLWLEGEEEDVPPMLKNEKLPAHISVESRREQFQSCMKLYDEVMNLPENEIIIFYLYHSDRIYQLLGVAMSWYPQYFAEHNLSIQELYGQIYQGTLEDIAIIERRLHLETRKLLEEKLNELYQTKLAERA